MPDEPRRAATKSAVCFFQPLFKVTARERFGRSKPVTTETTLPPKIFASISVRVGGSAVAVSPMTGVSGKCVLSADSSAYSGRNAGPHCEMQCASSMAKSWTPILASAPSMASVMRRSGER